MPNTEDFDDLAQRAAAYLSSPQAAFDRHILTVQRIKRDDEATPNERELAEVVSALLHLLKSQQDQ